MLTTEGECRIGASIGPICSSMQRVSANSSASGISFQAKRGLPMSTVETSGAVSFRQLIRQAWVSKVSVSRPVSRNIQFGDAAHAVAAGAGGRTVIVVDAYKGVGAGHARRVERHHLVERNPGRLCGGARPRSRRSGQAQRACPPRRSRFRGRSSSRKGDRRACSFRFFGPLLSRDVIWRKNGAAPAANADRVFSLGRAGAPPAVLWWRSAAGVGGATGDFRCCCALPVVAVIAAGFPASVLAQNPARAGADTGSCSHACALPPHLRRPLPRRLPPTPARPKTADPFGEEVGADLEDDCPSARAPANWDSAFDTLVETFKKSTTRWRSRGSSRPAPPVTIYTATDDTGFEFEAVSRSPRRPRVRCRKASR